MKADPRVLLGLAIILLAAVTVGCGGDDEDRFRIGVLTDCVGIYRTLDDAQLSGAQLPLIARGAELRGARPGEGLTQAHVAGRPVELIRACTETGEFTTMFEQVRRLVEREGADAIVGGAVGLDGIGLRQVAALYPDVTFVALPNGPREVTLRERTANLYRVAADHGQGVAGLGTYAYRDLGWRKAAVLALDWDAGWGGAAAFVAEFCALGGLVTQQERLAGVDPSGADAERVPADVDGVAVFTTPFFATQSGLLRQLAARLGDPAQRLVLGPSVIGENAALRATGRALAGVVGASRHTRPIFSAAMDEYVHSYRATFPGLPAEFAQHDFVIAYRNAVEALLQAFERAEGDTTAVQNTLTGLETTLLGEPVRIDENGQAVVSTTLVRIGSTGATGLPALEHVRTIPDVDQSIGGVLDAAHRPGARDEPCRKAVPPPWAR